MIALTGEMPFVEIEPAQLADVTGGVGRAIRTARGGQVADRSAPMVQALEEIMGELGEMKARKEAKVAQGMQMAMQMREAKLEAAEGRSGGGPERRPPPGGSSRLA